MHFNFKDKYRFFKFKQKYFEVDLKIYIEKHGRMQLNKEAII